MAIQGLDLRILHRLGKHNTNADALSGAPVIQSEVPQDVNCKTIAAIETTYELAVLQRQDKGLKEIIDFLESGRGRDWDTHLPYVLFAYRASDQQSTQESPFFLLYGCDPRLPTEAALSPSKKTRQQMDLHEYGIYIADKLAEAWDLAQKNIKKTQRQQKKTYD